MVATERGLSHIKKSFLDLLYLSITASHLDEFITDWVEQVYSFVTIPIFKLYKSLAQWQPQTRSQGKLVVFTRCSVE